MKNFDTIAFLKGSRDQRCFTKNLPNYLVIDPWKYLKN